MISNSVMKMVASVCVLISACITGISIAADDPSIKGELRSAIKNAMGKHVTSHTVGQHYVVYDAVKGNLKKLTFKNIHTGVVKKGDFYVSCADFVDAKGRLYDLDFLVAKTKQGFRVIQPVVHAVDGKKRPYHVEG